MKDPLRSSEFLGQSLTFSQVLRKKKNDQNTNEKPWQARNLRNFSYLLIKSNLTEDWSENQGQHTACYRERKIFSLNNSLEIL